MTGETRHEFDANKVSIERMRTLPPFRATYRQLQKVQTPFLSVVLIFGVTASLTAQPVSTPVILAESKPVTSKNVTFSVLGDTKWCERRLEYPIDIQLRIVNQSDKEILLSVFDSFGPALSDEAGDPVSTTAGRNGTAATRPVLIPAGSGYSIVRRAELKWDPKLMRATLFYWDGTGTEQLIGPIAPGNYKLHFWYSTNNVRAVAAQDVAGRLPIWRGHAETGFIRIVVGKE